MLNKTKKHLTTRYIKGSLTAIFSLPEKKREGYKFVPQDVEGVSITSRRIPISPDDPFQTAWREFTINASQRGKYHIRFEYKNQETGHVEYSNGCTFIFKRRFLGLF